MAKTSQSRQELLLEIETLRQLLKEAEGTLHAIGQGEVDAFVVSGPKGAQVFTLEGADQPYRIMVETMQEGAANLTAEGAILYANNRLASMLQTPLERLVGKPFEAYITPGDRAFFRTLLENTIHQRVGGEIVLHSAEGDSVPVQVSCGASSHSGGEAISVVFTDLTAQKRTEAELKRTKDILQTAMDQSPAGIAIADAPEGRLHYVNRAGLSILGGNERALNAIGIDQYLDRWLILDVDGEPLDLQELPIVRAIRFGETTSRELTIRRGEGDDRIILANAAPIRAESQDVAAAVVVFTDITAIKTAEKERLTFEKLMFETQKLESLGVLAGGIAHDFNNILTTIIGNADLALMHLRPESPAIDNLRKVLDASTRAADLSRQMLAYSGKGKFTIEALDMNRILEEMLNMLEVSISKSAILRLNLSPDLPSVEADATQLRQVVMNLILNASEAIGEKSGVIAVTTGCQHCDSNYLNGIWLHENLREGLYVTLEVSDTGCGMGKEVLAKIFDPFFTTKFTGRGLGMAAVLGIIKGHKGGINVYSEPGRGTTFKLMLPASGLPTATSDNVALLKTWQGSGTVLLVDDEETVRGVGVEMLKELGFKAITARDGLEALAIFRETPDIDLVILDLTMPHMNGEQCFRELRRLQPDIKVFISSGYSEQEVSQKFIGKGLSGFLQKPFRLSTLRDTLQGME